MAKLYPPTISGIIPAFCGGTIMVPFSMNKAVGRSEVGGFSLKIKTINNIQKEVLSHTFDSSDEMVGNTISFTIPSSHIKNYNVGQYYKIQLAYLDNDKNVGHYSTVGVVKYTARPSLVITGLTSGSINQHRYSYTAVYNTQNADTTEKLYNYRWILRDSEDNIIEDSGLQLHNVNNDGTSYEAIETFYISRDFPIGETYTIQFLCTTTNGLSLKTPRYKITQRQSVNSEIDVDLKADLDFDNGLVRLSFSRSATDVISGTLLLTRRDVADAYNWEELKRFNLHSIYYGSWSFVDYTIEQGKTYQYSLQQYNLNGVYSNRILSNEIYADFEDAFLYDGQRQLCIRFNPKVSTYKRNIPEGKVDTIGSKYAFITRNGNVNYKEFALSGLISEQMDPDNLYGFAGRAALEWPETDLVSRNIAAERNFKNDVLDWLTDGKIKLLRTPTEGNYLVRLMNVSMSPMDQLGRMLHTFSCSAYEMAEMTNEGLQTFGIIDNTEELTTQKHWASVKLNDAINNAKDGDWITLINRTCDSIFVVDMIPGDKIRITFVNNPSNPQEVIQIGATGSYRAENVGAISKIEFWSGEKSRPYSMPPLDGGSEDIIYVPGILTYSYDVAATGSFGDLEKVNNFEVPCRQFIGKSWSYKRDWYDTHIISEDDIANKYNLDPENRVTVDNAAGIGDTVIWHYYKDLTDIIDCVNDAKYDVGNIYFLRAFKREVKTAYKLVDLEKSLEETRNAAELGITFYADRDCTQVLDLTTLEDIYLYEIREVQMGIDRYGQVKPFAPNSPERADFIIKKNSGYYIDAEFDEFAPLTHFVIDGAARLYDGNVNNNLQHEIFLEDKDLFSFVVNGTENINIADTEDYKLYDCSMIKTLEPNHGVIIEIGYPVQEKIYSQETTSAAVILAKQNWENSVKVYRNVKDGPLEGDYRVPNENTTGFNPQQFEMMNGYYYNFLRELTKALAQYKLGGGED